MGGGLLALLAAEGALLTYLSFHPPVPGSVSTQTAAQGPDVAANSAAAGIVANAATSNAPVSPALGAGAAMFPAPGAAPTGAAPNFPAPSTLPPGASAPPAPKSPASGVASLPSPPPAFIPPPRVPFPVAPNSSAPVESAPPRGGQPAVFPSTPPDSKRAQAAALFDQAATKAKAGDTKGALALWERVAALAPDNLPTQQNLALLLAPTNPQKALIHARTAAKLAPADPRAQFQFARILLALHKPQEALVPLRATTKLAPKERDGHALLARALVDAKQPRAAYEEWASLAEANKTDLEAHMAAATLAGTVLKRPDDARKWLVRAQSAYPKDPNPPLALAQLAMARRQPKEAVAVLAAAVKTSPDSFELYPALADARIAAKDPKGAVSALQSAISRLPKGNGAAPKEAVENTEGRLHLAMGRLLGDQKQPREARQQFALAAKLLPRAVEPRALGALAEIQLKNPSGAITLLQSAATLDPKNPTTQLLLAQTLAGQKKAREADAAFARYCALEPRDATALTQWASVAAQLKDSDKETRVLQKAAALDGKNPLLWARLGAVQLRSNRKRDALATFQKMAKLSPRDLNAPLQIAALQRDLGDSHAAFGTLKGALTARPDYAPAYSLLLQAGETSGQSEAARAFVARQLASHADDAPALSQTLAFYDAKKRGAEAKALLTEIVARNPKAALAKNALASFDAKEQASSKTASTKVP